MVLKKSGEVRMKKIGHLYHVTDAMNVEKILAEGLVRGGGVRKAFAVYLSKSPLSWWKPGMVILRINVKDLIGEWTDFAWESDELLYWGDIEPSRIEVYEPTAIEHLKMIDMMRV